MRWMFRAYQIAILQAGNCLQVDFLTRFLSDGARMQVRMLAAAARKTAHTVTCWNPVMTSVFQGIGHAICLLSHPVLSFGVTFVYSRLL